MSFNGYPFARSHLVLLCLGKSLEFTGLRIYVCTWMYHKSIKNWLLGVACKHDYVILYLNLNSSLSHILILDNFFQYICRSIHMKVNVGAIELRIESSFFLFGTYKYFSFIWISFFPKLYHKRATIELQTSCCIDKCLINF